jgi:ribonuclease E
MPNKMLIDAAHPEETRVVVLRGSRVEEFDFESASRRQLRGNIYLAKVTRVEPSLQAAFVDYGGNRHGFLAFSEIHPDYYQIPVADRQALIEAEERENQEADEKAATDAGYADSAEPEPPAGESALAESQADAEPGPAVSEPAEPSEALSGESAQAAAEPTGPAEGESAVNPDPQIEREPEGAPSESNGVEVVSDDRVESVGAEDALEELPERRRGRVRQYKIQEVIKRRQVLLVQVVKEERGNKGAALTTYLSLAGRYSVLMPNTARGGGISRKITSVTDRKRLKQVASDLEVPEGMGVILRTAGASRTRAEVKRDFEYLLRLWENVRELTLRSTAPALVYEEGSLIKRSIRDLYNKDIDEIVVAGEDAYREAKDFMRMLMPSHAKNVQPYREKQPLFARSGIEAQLDAMFSPQVTLRSGGYVVINQTEALVAIDVNSGRSTREHNIEDTAHQTNLEAAEEVARQLRLRDLAGLIVIDFIDMEEKRNNRSVERKLKEALKNDRARIQVGRISHFGLLEMSRQRIRTGVLESTTTVCPLCQGSGHIRAPASVALHVLRSLEDQLLKGVTHHLTVHTRTSVALYILNQKRAHLSELESRFGLTVSVAADETIANGAHFTIERGEAVEYREPPATSVQPDSVQPTIAEEEPEPEPEYAEPEDEEVADNVEEHAESDTRGPEGRDRHEPRGDDDQPGGRKRRRRRRGRGRGEAGDGQRPTMPGRPEPAMAGAVEIKGDDEDAPSGEPTGAERIAQDGSDEGGERKRRRGRRGGRRGRRGRGGEESGDRLPRDGGYRSDQRASGEAPQNGTGDSGGAPMSAEDSVLLGGDGDLTPMTTEREPEREPVPTPEEHAPREPAYAEPAERYEPPASHVPVSHVPASHVEEKRHKEVEAVSPAPAHEPTPPPNPPEEDLNRPKRGGWWQRRTFF